MNRVLVPRSLQACIARLLKNYTEEELCESLGISVQDLYDISYDNVADSTYFKIVEMYINTVYHAKDSGPPGLRENV